MNIHVHVHVCGLIPNIIPFPFSTNSTKLWEFLIMEVGLFTLMESLLAIYRIVQNSRCGVDYNYMKILSLRKKPPYTCTYMYLYKVSESHLQKVRRTRNYGLRVE